MKSAVVLMAYGSPERLSDVPAYYADIRGGRPIAPERLAELVERYRRLGIEDSSPLNAVTEEIRAALEDAFDQRRVRDQLAEPLPGRRVVGHDPIGQKLLRIHATGARGSLALPDLLEVGPEEAVQLADVAHLRAARVGAQDPFRVGHHRRDLLPDQLGRSKDVDRHHLTTFGRRRGPIQVCMPARITAFVSTPAALIDSTSSKL